MSSEKILLIPQIPPQIIDAINNNRFAVFIGAGASISIGSKSWKDIAENLVKKCYNTPKRSNTSQSCINYRVRDALLQMTDYKKVITICQYILLSNEVEEEFYREIEKLLESSEDLEGQNIYDELQGLRGLCITTNIDSHFDKHYIPSQIVIGGFNEQDIDRLKLYHIHGSIEDKSSLILNVKQYFHRYNRDKHFRAFLERIFGGYTVLFIGYGLTEFELLDFLFTKYENSSTISPRHFILLPYYSGEETIIEFDKHYFSELGISVIPFLKDERGWGQLFHVINKWKKEILQISHHLSDVFTELKIAADNYTPSSEGHILQLISSEKAFENEFFKQLSQSANSFKWISTLNQEGYFNPKNNPRLLGDYYRSWNIIDFLETVAKLSQKNPPNGVLQELQNIVDSIISYRDEEGNRIENPFTDRYLVRIIFHFPKEFIKDEYFTFIANCLNSKYDPILVAGEIGDTILPKLIETDSKDILLKLVDVILGYRKNEIGTFEEYSSLMGRYYFSVFLEKYMNAIHQIGGIEVLNITLKKIDTIVSEDPSQFNIVWIPSIKEEYDFERYESQLIHFIWTGLISLGTDSSKDLIETLLKKDHPIFKRIALCEIDQNYDMHGEIFWRIEENPLEEYYTGYEVYELLKNNCRKFSDQQISKIIIWIETKKYHDDEISDEVERERYLAYKKKEWLSALLPSMKPNVLELYHKYDTINPADLRHPGRPISIEKLSGTVSPITKEDLLQKSNHEIVDYLNNFHEEGFGWTKISAHALCDVFRQSINENPKKFVQDLNPLLHLKRSYQYALILGLEESWRAEKDFEWNALFPFLISIIQSEEFLTENYQERRTNYRDLIISGIADLIGEGTRKDTHLFDLSLLPQAKQILLELDRLPKSDLYDMGDLVTSVLNSPKGKIYSSMIDYSLCYARHNRKEDEIKWDEEIKEVFSSHLQEKSSVEFFETLGKYLLNLCFLDKKWVRENINQIFLKENEVLWKATFTGYIFYSKLWLKVYNLLKMHRHYSKAIETTFEDRHLTERLIQHICIGYFEGLESLEEDQSLINQVISRWEQTQINEIIRYTWWIAKERTPEKQKQVKSLWEMIFSKSSSDLSDPKNIAILSELNDWISLIDEIDQEIYKMLMLSARYIKPHYSEFVEELNRLMTKSPKYTGDIFLTMIEAGHYFYFDKEKIITFITGLYENGEKESADKICNTYLLHGFDFLNDVYTANL